MEKFIHGMVVAAVLAFAFASPAGAQVVQRSGNVFHVAVCPQPLAPNFARCHAHAVTDNAGHHLVQFAAVATTPSGLNPTQLRSAYKHTATGSQSTTIAIVDAYGYTNAEADLAVYRSYFKLPTCSSANGCFAKYNEKGVKSGYPSVNVGWDQETALDLDMASAMCPNCKIILVEATSASFSDLAAAVNTAARLGAHVISNSYGGGESGSQSYEAAYNHAGVAVLASSGDSGYGVQFPAASPHVIAVGGTTLTQSATTRGWTETAWADGGSGCSKLYAKPAWQTDPLCTMRMEADVSAVADPNTGVAVYAPISSSRSAWQVFGGTSVSSPLIGGIYGANGGAVTYGSNPYANKTALFDVVSGSNGSCAGTYFCKAGAGYDGPTGLGTPNGASAF